MLTFFLLNCRKSFSYDTDVDTIQFSVKLAIICNLISYASFVNCIMRFYMILNSINLKHIISFRIN